MRSAERKGLGISRRGAMDNRVLLDNLYRVETKLGSGGSGTVHMAWHMRLQKHVAIKEAIDASQDRSQSQRNEFEALENVRSRYLPKIYGFVSEDKNSFTVMEYIEGENFGSLLRRGCRFTCSETMKWYSQLVSALGALHRQNICHRDIKPSNIMLKPDGDLCLIDFDSALVNGKATNSVSRSIGYASPEQYELYELVERSCRRKPNHAIDDAVRSIDWKRSDIYSLGATIYHLLTGERPHERAAEVIPIKKLDCYDKQIVRIIEKSMRQKPSERYGSATELGKAIARARRLC